MVPASFPPGYEETDLAPALCNRVAGILQYFNFILAFVYHLSTMNLCPLRPQKKKIHATGGYGWRILSHARIKKTTRGETVFFFFMYFYRNNKNFTAYRMCVYIERESIIIFKNVFFSLPSPPPTERPRAWSDVA